MYGIVIVGTRNCQAYDLSLRHTQELNNEEFESCKFSYAIKRILIPAIIGQENLETRLDGQLTENE